VSFQAKKFSEMSSAVKHTIIIGSGFAGIAMAVRLKQTKNHDFIILEKGDDIGGTWRDNHYPGSACDIPSHLYSFSFSSNPYWTKMYSSQDEILQYMRSTFDRFGLRPHLRVRSDAVHAQFDDASGLWSIKLQSGELLKARFVVSCTGGLSRPSMPSIEGVESFKGTIFHSARWDHKAELKGQRVAIVGTGASAIQIIPAIATDVEQMTVFQRSAAWVVPRSDRVYSEDEKEKFAKFPWLQRLHRNMIYARLELGFLALQRPKLLRLGQKLVERCLTKKIRDPELRRKLTPDYTIGCKRILLSNDYYPALQRPNVEVETQGIKRIYPDGIETKDGRMLGFDIIVFATGFKAAEDCVSMPVIGLGGRDLATTWADGAEAYLGTTVHNFPNWYFIVGPNTGLGHNSMLLMIESQVNYISDAMVKLETVRAKFADITSIAQRRYNSALQRRLKGMVWEQGGCVSWYRTSTGKNTTLWPGFTFEYRWKTRHFDISAYRVVSSLKTDNQ